MITDQSVAQLFSSFSNISLGLTEAEIKIKNKQLFKSGLFKHETEIDFPVKCARHLSLFARMNVIPEYCFDCYKVIISPRSVVELFKLLMIFNSDQFDLVIENTRKCMVEERDYCSGAYKGFIYCKGLEDGKTIFELTQKAIAKHISPDVDVKLKRGCSEYSTKYPNFERPVPGEKMWEKTMPYFEAWRVKENFYDANFSATDVIPERSTIDQTAYPSTDGSIQYLGYEVFAMQYWLRYAATIGDESYLDIAGKTLPPLPHLEPRGK